jgi:hypothetical protein
LKNHRLKNALQVRREASNDKGGWQAAFINQQSTCEIEVTMRNINEITATRNRAQQRTYPNQLRRTPLHQAQSIRVFIASNVAHGSAYYAAVIYNGTAIAYCFDGWLDDSTAERAWLRALNLAYEWRDQHAPNARLIICESSDKQAHRRAA